MEIAKDPDGDLGIVEARCVNLHEARSLFVGEDAHISAVYAIAFELWSSQDRQSSNNARHSTPADAAESAL